MSVYEPLTKYLKSLPNESWSTNFMEIERILRRSLPQSALEYRPWWANQKGGNHSQSRAWRDAGWETREVDLKNRTLRFERMKRLEKDSGSTPSGTKPNSPDAELWSKAHRLTGIEDRDALIAAALTALIRREAAKQLTAMGGTMPDFAVPPRERPAW